MDFFIKRNSTLPKLKMRLISDTELDYKKFDEMLENCSVTFSMVSVDTKTMKIANKEAEVVVEKLNLVNNQDDYIYYIEYNWTEKDTNKTGTFIGEFKIDFLEPNCGSIIVPIREPLYIHIDDSITKTTTI